MKNILTNITYRALNFFARATKSYDGAQIFGSWLTSTNPNDLDVVFLFSEHIPCYFKFLCSLSGIFNIDAKICTRNSDGKYVFYYYGRNQLVALEAIPGIGIRLAT